MLDNKYSKEWRLKLGFSNQEKLKFFFKAKDSGMIPAIDNEYIKKLNKRILEILMTIKIAIHQKIPTIMIKDISSQINFLQNRIITKIDSMNNNGRRKEEVYFSWLRGQVLMEFFIPCLEYIFDSKIIIIGDDYNQWNRTAKADLEVKYKSKKIRLEIQTGFQGINDIKKHKIVEAKKVRMQESIETYVIHFDFFNGIVAFVNISLINDNDINWISRERMEGQIVFNINSSYFVWKLQEEPPKFQEINNLLK